MGTGRDIQSIDINLVGRTILQRGGSSNREAMIPGNTKDSIYIGTKASGGGRRNQTPRTEWPILIYIDSDLRSRLIWIKTPATDSTTTHTIKPADRKCIGYRGRCEWSIAIG